MTLSTLRFPRAEHGTISIERQVRALGARLLRISYTRTHAVVLVGGKAA